MSLIYKFAAIQKMILYEDNHLISFNKPAGLLVQGDRTGDPTLFNIAKAYLAQRYSKTGNVYLGLLHRIDRPASGVVLFAKTSKAAKRMCNMLKTHQIRKRYWAVVHGAPSPPCGELRDYVIRHGTHSFVSKESNLHARLATLTYKIFNSATELTLVEINLETGRHHQIRVQFASRGYPIIGDKKYGSKFTISGGRIALLARCLDFIHPVSLKQVIIEAPVPTDWPWIEVV